MEPVTAAWLVGLLADHAAKLAGAAVGVAVEKVEDLAAERIKVLVATIRRYFSTDPAASDALDRLEEAPEDPRRRGAVEERLEEALAGDPHFAATVARLAEQIHEATPRSVTVVDSGSVAVNGSVNIRADGHAAGRDLSIRGLGNDSAARVPRKPR